jgi:hypothetical protein
MIQPIDNIGNRLNGIDWVFATFQAQKNRASYPVRFNTIFRLNQKKPTRNTAAISPETKLG